MRAPGGFPMVALCVSLSLSLSFPAAAKADDEPRLAIVSGTTVNVVTRGVFGEIALERADLASGKARPSSPLADPNFRRSSFEPHRWRIAHGFYWAVTLKGGRGDGGFGGGGGFRRAMFQPVTAHLVRIPLADLRADAGPVGVRQGPPTEVGAAEPLTSAIAFARLARVGPVYYDLVPIGTHACRLFVLFDGEIEVWDYRFQFDPKDAVVGHWKEVRRIAVDWNEPFLALTEGPDRLFLAVSSGTLWEVPDGPAAPRAVWSDPTRPVRWIVLDPARDRTFALGASFSFRVSARPRPQPLAPSHDPDEPLSSALRAARLVLPAP